MHPRNKQILFGERDEWKDAILQSTTNTFFDITFKMFIECLDYSEYDLVIPLSIHDQCVLNKYSKNKNVSINSIFASDETIDLTNDKHHFNQFLKKHGFGNYVPENKKKGEFPYILKKRISEFGTGCYIINNIDDELKYIDFINDTENYFTQEIIIGEIEYTTHIVYNEGIVFDLSYEFTYYDNIFVKGKNTEGKMASIIDPPFLDLWSKILKQLNFSGIGCFNYKIVKGKPMIFEFNPRFGASLTNHAATLIEALLKHKKVSFV